MSQFLEAAERVFGAVDPEVWIVTAGDQQCRGGLLATWVMRTSLAQQRPVALLGLAPNHHTTEILDRTGTAAIHLLRPAQTELALNFAESSGYDRDKFENYQVAQASNICPAPVLQDCLGWMAGTVFGRLDAGDRIFFWLEITAADYHDDGPALRQSQLFAAASEASKQRLKDDLARDSQFQLPLQAAWGQLLQAGQSKVTTGCDPAQ